jgi:hypothetical protein
MLVHQQFRNHGRLASKLRLAVKNEGIYGTQSTRSETVANTQFD